MCVVFDIDNINIYHFYYKLLEIYNETKLTFHKLR